VRMDRIVIRGQPTPARAQTGEDRTQVLSGNDALKAELLRALPGPPAFGLAGARVVIVEGLGDASQLVGLGTHAELCHGQHIDLTHPKLGVGRQGAPTSW
jgi:hypothetical protein